MPLLLSATDTRDLTDESRAIIGKSFLPRAEAPLSDIARILLLIPCGQSNAAARGKPFGGRFDIPDRRMLMAQWIDTSTSSPKVDSLVPATVPVSTQAAVEDAGYGIGDVIAKRILADQPDTLLVKLNVAKGGAGLVFDTSNGVWAVDYAGTNRKLFPLARAAITKTLDLIHTQYPGVPVDIQFVWHQGESDSTTSYADYYAALRALILAFRTHVGDPTAPFVMGGTVPEVSDPTEEANVMGAQIAICGDLEYVAFTPGIHNGGGSKAPTGDTVHYHRDGVERLGSNMYEALLRAYANTVTSNPLPSLDVTARWRKSAGVLDMAWSFPTSRVTGFLPQYRIDGGAWRPITGRPRELDPVATVTGLTTGGELEVRVATVNDVGTSAYTAPVYALTA